MRTSPRTPAGRTALRVAAVLVLAAALVTTGVVAGRLSAHREAASPPDLQRYLDGLRVGEAEGRREGRALQEGAELPAGSRDAARAAFDAGYVAGTNDAFGGYDGGWVLAAPYLVTLEAGTGEIVYRIRSRTPLAPNVDYYLCPDRRSVCEQPRR